MNILVVCPCFPPAWSWGGSVRSLWTMCRGLAAAGARVRVVTTDMDLSGRVAVPRERSEQGVSITTLPALAWPRRYGAALGLPREVWRQSRSAELAVLQGIWTFPVAVGSRICRLRRLPYVLCARGWLEELSLSEKASKKKMYMRLVESETIAGAVAVQFDTRQELQNSARAIGGRPAIVQPSTLEFQERVESQAPALRRQLGLPEDSLLAGLSGRVHPRKGFEVIVPALSRCSERIHLVSFGPNEEGYRGVVERLAEREGVGRRVHFLGQLTGATLQATYASMDLIVLPSFGESFGNVLIEALAQGTEVMVSQKVALADYILENRLGSVVSSLEPQAWARALGGWAARAVSFDGDRASDLVRRDFDFRTGGARLLADYERLLAAPPSGAPAQARGTS